MHTIYNFLTRLTEKILPVFGYFSPKMKLFYEGRKTVFSQLRAEIIPGEAIFWFHAASLGEYEQAVPLIRMLQQEFPNHRILLSFFSPSGYEIKKNNSLVDIVCYLPLDTPENAKLFLEITQPKWVFFIKYEFWPNYLTELKEREIKTLLISGSFRKNQVFFKSYGTWMQSYLKAFEHFFVQNKQSEELLHSIGFYNTTLSGDTRFDRVSHQIEQDNTLDLIAEFKNEKITVVAGSTWPEDEELLLEYINSAPKNIKFIIAPHSLNHSRIEKLKQQITSKKLLFSEKEGKNLAHFQVFIIDTIGLLTRIYSYADISYVGGAAGKTGLHNILEPATFGIPIITGKKLENFPEALKLQQLGGLFSVVSPKELNEILDKLIRDKAFRKQTGMICGHYISSNTGATERIKTYLLNPS